MCCDAVVQSIKHHEGGRKHKETVEKFFKDKRKEKFDEAKRQKEIDRELEKVEKVLVVASSSPCLSRCCCVTRSPSSHVRDVTIAAAIVCAAGGCRGREGRSRGVRGAAACSGPVLLPAFVRRAAGVTSVLAPDRIAVRC